MPQPLPPDAMYPAGVPGVAARFIDLSSGVRVRVAESGPADGMPAVLLHGWGASLYLYRRALEFLPRYGVRAIAVDMRGFGLSDKPSAAGSCSLDSYCADLDALLDALALSRVVLVGQSMGGGLALRFALRSARRVRGLALINPSGLVPIPLMNVARVAPRALTRALDRRLMQRWMVRFILRHIAYADPALATERDLDEYWAPTQLPGFVIAARSALSEFDWRPLSADESASLAVPSVVMLGESDRLVRQAAGAARRLRGAEVVSIPGGHCVHEESPELAYGIIGEFCRRVLSES